MPDPTIRNVRISPLCPVRFFPANEQRPRIFDVSPYLTWKFDHGFYHQQKRVQQTSAPYITKYWNNDAITLYFDSLADTMELYLMDCHGNATLLDTLAPVVVVEGNTYIQDDGIDSGLSYNTFYSYMVPSSFSIGDGIWYFMLKAIYTDGYDTLVSEPFAVRSTNWPKTLLIEYQNTKNDYGVMFDGVISNYTIPFGLMFQSRVESFLDDPEIASVDNVFRDVTKELRNLRSEPYRRREFIVGGGIGVPAYVTERISRALSCDTIKIDDTQVIKDESTLQMTITKNEFNQLRTGSIYLQEKREQQNWSFTFRGSVLLIELNYDEEGNRIYPYAINYLGMTNGDRSIITDPFIIEDSISEAAYIAMLNSVFLPANRGTGHYLITNDAIYYNNGAGEQFNALPGMYQYIIHVSAELDISEYNRVRCILQAVSGVVQLIVGYGDGDRTAAEVINLTTAYRDLDHVYTAVTDPTLRIFHPLSGIKVIGFGNDISGRARVKNITSDSVAPNTLEDFRIGYGLGYGAFDTSFLKYCKDTLKFISFSVTTGPLPVIFAQNVFDVFDGSGEMFEALTTVWFSSVNMDSVSVNAIISAFETNCTVIDGGTFIITTQDGTNPPSGGPLAFLDDLATTHGYFTLHD